jgi:putative membrane protein
MGFGFVVARFGLFLRELGAQHGVPAGRFGASQWIGVTLVALGAAATAMAGARHVTFIRRYDRGEPLRLRAMTSGVLLAALLVLLGLLLVGYLLRLF